MTAFVRRVRDALILFIFFAVCGWCYEVLLTAITFHIFENRGVLFGPWLPIYGFGGVTLYALFGRLLKKPVRVWKINIRVLLIFLYICVLATVIELAASYLLDIFGGGFLRLWDYRGRELNFEGRVSLSASLEFGLLGVAGFYIGVPLFERFTQLKNEKAVDIVSWTVIALFLIDAAARIPLGSNYIDPYFVVN